MNASIQSHVSAALTAAGAYSVSIDALRSALKGQLSPEVRATLLPYVATFYGVALVDKERGEGKTFDVNAKKFEAAKKALQRLTADIVGKSKAQAEELEVPAEMLALARKLVKLGNTYEQAGKLIAAAIATAKAE